MSEVERISIHGRLPPNAFPQRLEKRRSRLRALRQEKARKTEKPEDFVTYEESEEEDEGVAVERKYLRTSYNFIDYIRSREMGMRERRCVNFDFPSRHILSHEMFKEHPISLNNINKIFCSQWLSDRQVVFGTKCNKLMVYDVVTQKLDQIPLLSDSASSGISQDQQCGIHTAQINPSRSLLATGAKNSSDIAIYRLPTMDPVCIGDSHKDWVFDVCWLDDQFLVSGSKDSKMGLWKIVDEYKEESESETPSYKRIEAVSLKACKSAQRVRAVAFNSEFQEIAALSLNGFIHIWNAETFRQTHSRKLPSSQENVCLAVKKGGLYGIGCRSYTLLLDPRTLHPVKKISAKFSGCGIRSASFQGDILTIGTGVAILMFYDLRAHKYLESSINSSRTVNLKSSRGYVMSSSWTEYKLNTLLRYTLIVMISRGRDCLQQVGPYQRISMGTTQEFGSRYISRLIVLVHILSLASAGSAPGYEAAGKRGEVPEVVFPSRGKLDHAKSTINNGYRTSRLVRDCNLKLYNIWYQCERGANQHTPPSW